MEPPVIGISYYFGRVAGVSANDFHCLGYRHDASSDLPDDGESWVLQASGEQLWTLYGGPEWLTGIWRSPSGAVFVSSASGTVHHNPDLTPFGTEWTTHKLKYPVKGVWGLDDSFVLAWGARGDDAFVSRWDGKRWKALPAPPGQLWTMHGIAPDLVYGVGEGLITRWDGSRWHQVESPVDSMLVSVFVHSQDEMYACSSEGRILEGSAYGWSHMLDYDGHASEVAKWNGQLWLAAPDEGLHQFDGKKLLNLKPNIRAAFFCAGEELLMAAHDAIVSTPDGKRFMGKTRHTFAAMLAGKEPTWLPAGTEFEELPLDD